MDELTAFGFYPAGSLLHRLDARFKLVFLVSISIAGLRAEWLALVTLTVVAGIVLLVSRRSLFSILIEIRYFFVFLLLICFVRSISTQGTCLIKTMFFSITQEGIRDGILISWRLLLVVLFGMAFIATTRPSDIRAGVAWFLKPLPFIPHKKVATMIGLVVRFVPVIFNQARETANAQKARGIENRKNPVYRLVRLGLPLVRRAFENADKLALAMEARCYSENRSDPDLSSGVHDWFAAVVVFFLCVFTIVL